MLANSSTESFHEHWWVRTGRSASSGPFPHPPRENRAYDFHHTTAHAERTAVGSSFTGFSRCIPPDLHPMSRPTTTASRLRRFPLHAALPRPAVGRHSHEYSRRSAPSHTPGFGPSLALFPHRALPLSGFVPARASEDSARVSPGLLTALLRIPCKGSRVPSDGLSDMVEAVVRCPSQPLSAAPSLGGGTTR